MDKSMFKMTPEELQAWLYLRKKGYVIENKKGKGSYTRKAKHKNRQFQGGENPSKNRPGARKITQKTTQTFVQFFNKKDLYFSESMVY